MLALLACLLTSCWQEIEYRPPAQIFTTASSDERTPPPAEVNDETTEQTLPEAAAPEQDSNVGDQFEIATAEPVAGPAVDPATETTVEERPANSAETTGETEATAVSTPIETTPPEPSISTHQAAWRLGSRLSLAALANDRSVAPEEVPKWFDEAKSMADMLKVTIAPLPEPPATVQGEGAPGAVEYLRQQLKTIGTELSTLQGDEQAALFDVAVKSNLLLIYNKPGSQPVETISKSIAAVLPRAALPADLTQPVFEVLTNGSPPAAVRQAVQKMHRDVDAHLAASVEQ